MLNSLFRDLRYAMRGLRRHPGFALAGILTLALGVGVNTAVFSLVNSLMLRPFPISDSHRVARIFTFEEGKRIGVSYEDFRDLRRAAGSFQELALSKSLPAHIGARGSPGGSSWNPSPGATFP